MALAAGGSREESLGSRVEGSGGGGLKSADSEQICPKPYQFRPTVQVSLATVQPLASLGCVLHFLILSMT